MKRSFKYCALLGALSISTPAAAVVLGNGSFEDGMFGAPLGGSQQVQPGDTSLSSWTVTGAPITWYQTGNNLNQVALTPHSGNFGINLAAGDGSVRFVSQTINLLPFTEYQLSFWVGNYSANNGLAAPVSVNITDGTSNTILLSETAAAPITNESSTWVQFVYNFIADGTSNTITFGEVANGPTYVGLDDVSITATPLPGALPLFVTGIGVIGLLGWRRKRRISQVNV
jgi:hypothetical protein